MCTLFILICLACTYFVYCSSSTTPEPLTTNPSESTYITFAVQWKPQFCYKNTAPNCHNELIPNITIHGIWPNSYNGSHPWYCSGPELQQKDIETIQQDLEIYWPTLSNSNTNFGFWGYQWQKHGRCWYSVNATQYFQYGILWMKTEGYKDIQTILASNGIYPSNEKEYLLQNVTNSLNNGLNQKSVVRCRNGKYISEFFVCRNWTAGKMDCPNNLLSNCNENVILSLQVLPDTVLPTTTQAITITAYNHNLTGHIPVWINELHYDNSGTDIDEFVEIAGIAGTDLSDYMIYLYNGATGTQYGELSFNRVTVNSSLIPDQQNGVGTAFISINGIQNGGADGIALVYAKKYVLQFLSYEGHFIARDGPAIGMESVDIMVWEDSNTIINTSLSLVGSGYEYQDFEWKGGVIATPGRINIGQIITEPISEITSPTTNNPTTISPTTINPTTNNPTTINRTITNNPTTNNPTTTSPTTINPTTTNPTTSSPTTTNPTTLSTTVTGLTTTTTDQECDDIDSDECDNSQSICLECGEEGECSDNEYTVSLHIDFEVCNIVVYKNKRDQLYDNTKECVRTTLENHNFDVVNIKIKGFTLHNNINSGGKKLSFDLEFCGSEQDLSDVYIYINSVNSNSEFVTESDNCYQVAAALVDGEGFLCIQNGNADITIYGPDGNCVFCGTNSAYSYMDGDGISLLCIIILSIYSIIIFIY